MTREGKFAWTYGGWDQSAVNGRGPLNMVFKKSNPLFSILAMLPDTLIMKGLSRGSPLVDLAMDAAAMGARFAKAVAWKDKTDPLVLDLNGDGIETSAPENGVWFNIDGGVFAKRTGLTTPANDFRHHELCQAA